MALTKGCTFSAAGGAAGSDLSAYSLGGEAAWTKHASHSSGAIVMSDVEQVRSNSSSTSLYYTDETPSSADYTISGVAQHLSTTGTQFVAIAARINTAADTFYYCFWNGSSAAWELWRRVAGSTKLIGSFPQTLTVGSYAFSLTLKGILLVVAVDGVDVIRTFDSNITAAGRVGLYAAGSMVNGSRTHFDTFGVSEPAAAGTDVVITSPAAYQIIQRDPDTNTADIAIEGTYTGSPTAIEARWNGGAWTTIDAAPAGGSYSGTLSGQSAGQGTLEVRWTNDTSKTASAEYVGVGEVFAILGQSNAVGQGTVQQNWSHATLKAGVFRNDNTWSQLADNHDHDYNQVDTVSSDAASLTGGSVWPKVATDLMAALGVAVGFVPCPKGNTAILAWQPGADHLDRSTLYGSANYRIGLAGGVRMVLWWQGENDSTGSTGQSTYNSRLDALAAALMADRGVKIMPCKLQYMSAATEADQDAINAAIAEAWADNEDVLEGPDLTDLVAADGLHVKSTADLTTAGGRWADAIEAEIAAEEEPPPEDDTESTRRVPRRKRFLNALLWVRAGGMKR